MNGLVSAASNLASTLDTPPESTNPTPAIPGASSTLSLSPTSLTLITGESATFSTTGGTPAYTYNSLLGYINSTTGVYAVPLGISPTSDTIRVNDNSGNQTSANVTISAFQN